MEALATNNPNDPSIPIIRINMVKEGDNLYSDKQITCPSKAVEVLKDFFDGLDREAMFVLCLDSSKHPVGINLVSVGSISSTIVEPREVFKPAILSNSKSIIIAHNHPSGQLKASENDLEITRRISHTGTLMGIGLDDHLIFAPDGNYMSLKAIHPDSFKPKK